MPVFAMAPGAIAAFSGSRLCHGTLEHDAERDRAEGHEAHVSFAIQIPSPIHGLKRVDVQDFDEDMLAKGRQDAAGLKDAVWIPVWDFNKHGGHAVEAGCSFGSQGHALVESWLGCYINVCSSSSAGCFV